MRRALPRGYEGRNRFPQRRGFGKRKIDPEPPISPLDSAGPGVLAQHQLVGAAQLLRIEGLIVPGVLEQPVDMDPRFMGEDAFADDALSCGNRTSGNFRDEPGKREESVGAHPAVDPAAVAEGGDDLFERGIARPLA